MSYATIKSKNCKFNYFQPTTKNIIKRNCEKEKSEHLANTTNKDEGNSAERAKGRTHKPLQNTTLSSK